MAFDAPNWRIPEIDDVTSKMAMTVFKESLRDPLNPKACAACLIGARSRLCGALGSNDNRLEHPSPQLLAYYDTAIALLMAPGTHEDVDKIISGLSQCQCIFHSRTASDYFHWRGQWLLDRSFYLGNNTGSILVNTILVDIFDTLEHANQLKTVQGRQSKRWPTSVKSIFPSGFADGVRKMVLWHRALKVEKAVPHFFVETVRLIGGGLSAEIRASQEFKDVYLSEWGRSYFLQDRPNPDELALQMERRLITIVEFLRVVADGSRHGSGCCLAEWFRGHQSVELSEKLLDATIDYAQNYRAGANRNRVQGSAVVHWQITCDMIIIASEMATTLTLASQEQLSPEWHRKNELVIELSSQGAKEDHQEPDVSLVWTYVDMVRKSRACLNEGCPSTVLDNQEKLRVCASCQTLRYCSKDCQKQDWKHTKFPHKTICKHIQLFIACWGETYPSKFPENVGFDMERGRDSVWMIDKWAKSSSQMQRASRF